MRATSGPAIDLRNAMLKIQKSGKSVEFFILNNNDWEKLGELNISRWGKSFYVGIATLSHDNSQLTKAQYSKINLIE